MYSFNVYHQGNQLDDLLLLKISEIDQRNMDHSWSYESWLDLKKINEILLVVLEFENEPVGFVLFLVQPIDAFAHLLSIAIENQFRGKKLANQLLELSFLKLNEIGIKTIQLEVSTKNSVAQNLYQKFGFYTSRCVAKFYRNGEDALIMLKEN